MSGEGSCLHYICTHEEAERLIKASEWFSLSNCGCRESNGGCERSRMDVCLSFDPADPGSGSGSRPVGLDEALGVLAEANAKHLITRPWRNAERTATAGVCNCCDDCCGYFMDENEKCDKGAMIENTDMSACTGCGACEPACHFGARKMAGEGLAVDSDRCYGCGLCVESCPVGCISMVPRSQEWTEEEVSCAPASAGSDPTTEEIDMNRVIHFEIHSADPDRAAKFYGEVFGWEFREWVIPGVQLKNEHRYWVVTTGGEGCGINGGLVYRRGPVPTPGMDANAFVCTVEVASLDEIVAKAVAAGAMVTAPKMPIPGVGWLAYCSDPDGNAFGLMQEDPGAL